MRHDFKQYLPEGYSVLEDAALKERKFPDRLAYLFYFLWRIDNQKNYVEKQILIERESMKDPEYIKQSQGRRGIEKIEDRLSGLNYNEVLDMILGDR